MDNMDNHQVIDIKEQPIHKYSDVTGKWLGWLGIIAGIIGFFYLPYWMGAAAIALGVFGLFSPQRTLNIVAIVVGAAAILWQFIL